MAQNINTLNLALCEGRHEIPEATHGSIFGAEISPKFIAKPALLEDYAFSRIWSACERNGLVESPCDESEGCRIVGGVHLNIYVTGLTIALVSVLNVCRDEGISVTLYHFNRETGEYYPQSIR